LPVQPPTAQKPVPMPMPPAQPGHTGQLIPVKSGTATGKKN
jgi:hypothetical protein